MSDLARRYAQELFGVTDDVEALRRTAVALMEDTALWATLRSPAVRAEEKERILARLPDLQGCETAAFLPAAGGQGAHGSPA